MKNGGWLPGFVPAAEPLLFRQKDPKPFWPWHGPSGALRGSPAPVAGKLAGLKQCPPFFPGPVALLGHATRPGEPHGREGWIPDNECRG